MANPPITIGPFANVPAPGSPIRSDWPQQITNYVVGRTAIIGQGATLVPAGNVDVNVTSFTALTGITWDVTIPAGGGRLTAVVNVTALQVVTADINAQVQLTIGAVSTGTWRVRRSLAGSGAANRFDLTFAGSRGGLSAGNVVVRPEFRLLVAGGALRADVESFCTLVYWVTPA